jgi:hypothetical protein
LNAPTTRRRARRRLAAVAHTAPLFVRTHIGPQGASISEPARARRTASAGGNIRPQYTSTCSFQNKTPRDRQPPHAIRSLPCCCVMHVMKKLPVPDRGDSALEQNTFKVRCCDTWNVLCSKSSFWDGWESAAAPALGRGKSATTSWERQGNDREHSESERGSACAGTTGRRILTPYLWMVFHAVSRLQRACGCRAHRRRSSGTVFANVREKSNRTPSGSEWKMN